MLNYKTAFHLYTKRCFLRMIELEDIDSFFELCNDEAVCKYLTFNPYENKNEANRVIQNMIRAYLIGECVNYAIVLQETNQLIGSVSLTFNPNKKTVELGYLLQSKYWNKGIMSEVLQDFIPNSFEYYDLSSIFAIVEEENEISLKLLIKNGFKLVSKDSKKIKIKNKYVNTFTLVKEK